MASWGPDRAMFSAGFGEPDPVMPTPGLGAMASRIEVQKEQGQSGVKDQRKSKENTRRVAFAIPSNPE